MAKKRLHIEFEADLHEAIEAEAKKRGISKDEVVRRCAQIFLHKVSDTSPQNLPTKRRRRAKPDGKSQAK